MPRGGKREGAGRKPADTKQVTIRLTADQHEVLKRIGGSKFIKQVINDVKEHKMAITIDTSKWSESKKEKFAEAFWDVSGIDREADNECGAPWAMPWYWQEKITVKGTTIEEWAEDFWDQCRKDYEDAAMVVVFNRNEDGTFSVSRESQAYWTEKCGYERFPQGEWTDEAPDGSRCFLSDEDAVDYLEENWEQFDNRESYEPDLDEDEDAEDLDYSIEAESVIRNI